MLRAKSKKSKITKRKELLNDFNAKNKDNSSKNKKSNNALRRCRFLFAG